MLTKVISNQTRLVRDVVMLPLRIGVDVTRLGLKVTWRLIEAAASHDRREARGEGPHVTSTRLDVVIVPASPAEPAATTAPDVPAEAEAGPPAVPIPPVHVSAQPELVESFAEPGAEDGAGAAVHVKEPWTGYRQMTANDVMSRLTDASSEELAAVALYEGSHRARRTVIAEAERRLRRAATTSQHN
jgi:hypothetical protein